MEVFLEILKINFAPMAFFTIVLIVDLIFFRKNIRDLKIILLLDILMLSVLYVVSSYITFFNDEAIKYFYQSYDTYRYYNVYYETFSVHFLVIFITYGLLNLLKMFLLKRNAVYISKLYNLKFWVVEIILLICIGLCLNLFYVTYIFLIPFYDFFGMFFVNRF